MSRTLCHCCNKPKSVTYTVMRGKLKLSLCWNCMSAEERRENSAGNGGKGE